MPTGGAWGAAATARECPGPPGGGVRGEKSPAQSPQGLPRQPDLTLWPPDLGENESLLLQAIGLMVAAPGHALVASGGLVTPRELSLETGSHGEKALGHF